MMTAAESQRSVLKVGAGLAVLGAILGLIGNGLHPHLTNPTVEEFLTHVASRADWTLLHLTIILSIFCILGGLFGIYRSILDEPAAGLARLGFAIAIAGSALVAVNFASDGMAMKYIANAWASAPAQEQAAMLPAATALDKIDLGFYTVWIFLFLGLPFAFYSLALVQSNAYPRWLGWLGLIGGAGCAVVGMMQYVGGETTLLTTLFLVFSIDITIWTFVMGIYLWRKSATNAVR
jgi:hypothetical protein